SRQGAVSMRPTERPATPRLPSLYVWTIAGSDCSGAAGLQADLKTITSLGVHGASLVTALTAQNPREVLAVEAVSPAMLATQWEALARHRVPDALKIGMLGDASTVRFVATRRPTLDTKVVLDPVL